MPVFAFGAAPARGEPRRFRADPCHGRPHEGIGAAAQARQMVLAEPRLRELDPRFERLGVHDFGMREIAQGELVGVVQVDAQLAGPPRSAGSRLRELPTSSTRSTSMAPRPGRSASPTSLIGGKCTAIGQQP